MRSTNLHGVLVHQLPDPPAQDVAGGAGLGSLLRSDGGGEALADAGAELQLVSGDPLAEILPGLKRLGRAERLEKGVQRAHRGVLVQTQPAKPPAVRSRSWVHHGLVGHVQALAQQAQFHRGGAGVSNTLPTAAMVAASPANQPSVSKLFARCAVCRSSTRPWVGHRPYTPQ